MIEVWAHQGAAAYAPGNTLPAFALAHRMGADGVELDAQLSADGQVVVIHDETVDRTTGLHGKVMDFTAAELAAMDAGEGAGIPTLDQVLALLAPTGMRVNIELKNSNEYYPGLEQAVLDVVDAHDMAERVVYSSFNHVSLAMLRPLTSSPIGVLTGDVTFEPWNYAPTFRATALHPHFRMLAIPHYVEQAHEAGLSVHPWTVDAEEDLAWMARLGVDVVISNIPDRALAVLGR